MGNRKIYGLYDPRKPELVMVVGQTSQVLSHRVTRYGVMARRSQRLGKRLCPSHKWVLELLAANVRPGIRLLGNTSDRAWRQTEKRFIKLYRKLNPGLLNVNPGGDGPHSGVVKEYCEIHGTKRHVFPSGIRSCVECRRAYKLSPRGRERTRAYFDSVKGRATAQAYKAQRKNHGR